MCVCQNEQTHKSLIGSFSSTTLENKSITDNIVPFTNKLKCIKSDPFLIFVYEKVQNPCQAFKKERDRRWCLLFASLLFSFVCSDVHNSIPVFFFAFSSTRSLCYTQFNCIRAFLRTRMHRHDRTNHSRYTF